MLWCCDAVWCCMMLCDAVWCCVVLCDVVWCCVILCDTVWCYDTRWDLLFGLHLLKAREAAREGEHLIQQKGLVGLVGLVGCVESVGFVTCCDDVLMVLWWFFHGVLMVFWWGYEGALRAHTSSWPPSDLKSSCAGAAAVITVRRRPWYSSSMHLMKRLTAFKSFQLNCGTSVMNT
jgi:hypothetical protein